MSKEYFEITCIHCGVALKGDHCGPCPACRKLGKKGTFEMSGGAVVGGTAPISTMRTMYQKNKMAFILLIIITFGGPFLGLLIAGIPGVLVGLALGAVGWFIGPRAITKVVEHHHYN